MKIQVHRRYVGKRARVAIEQGIYEQSDGKLFGLWRYLIDNGNARVYVEPVVATVEVEEEQEPEPEVIPEREVLEKPVIEKPKRGRKKKVEVEEVEHEL